MIKDRTAAEIREWVGKTTYEQHMIDGDYEDSDKHRFLYWIKRRLNGKNLKGYACQQIKMLDDDELVGCYLEWLLNGAGARNE